MKWDSHLIWYWIVPLPFPYAPLKGKCTRKCGSSTACELGSKFRKFMEDWLTTNSKQPEQDFTCKVRAKMTLTGGIQLHTVEIRYNGLQGTGEFWLLNPNVVKSSNQFLPRFSCVLHNSITHFVRPPKCLCEFLHHCPCPPACDWGSGVSGLVKTKKD